MTRTPGQRLVGRDDELRVLTERLDWTRPGGAVVGLVGEPGVGKSALLAAVAERAEESGVRVLSARGVQSETHLPFAGLHQLLQPLLPRADGLPGPQRDALLACFGMIDAPAVNPFFVALATLELLVDAAVEAPVLVGLDDADQLDRPSLDALAFVARRLGGEPVAVLATSRPGLSPFTDETLLTVEVGALDGVASAALLTARAPDLTPTTRDRILGWARGNPLALVELAGATDPDGLGPHGPDDLPMTARLERAFVARADELDATSRVVVDVAALHDGDDLDEVLAAADILRPEIGRVTAARSAVEVGLLALEGGGTYRMTHPLVGSALRRAMAPAHRREVHAALARVLSAQPDRAIWHRASSTSGTDEALAAGLERSATEAYHRGAISTALARVERAAALSPDADRRAARLLSAAELDYELGRFTQVEQITAQVAPMALPPRERSRLTWLRGAFHDGAGSEPAEIRHLVDLARRARADDDPDLATQLLIGAARRVWWRDPGEDVRADIVRAARETDLPADDPRVLAVLGLSESLELAPEVVGTLDRRSPHAGAPPEVAGLLGIAAFCVGDFSRADAFLSAAVDQLRVQGRLGLLAEALAIRSWAEINTGVFDASRSADEARRLADETGQAVWGATARIAVALTGAVAGEWEVSHPLLAEAEDTAVRTPNASSSLLAAVQLARGVAALGAGRPEPAYGELHRVFVPADPACQRVQQLWTVGYLADAARHADRRAEAETVLRSVERLAGDSPAPGPAIALEYSRAVLADDASAEELFRIALDGAGGPLAWHRARVELAYGSWLRRRRRVAESRVPLRAARSTFDAAGARPWALRADRELRATGERGWRPARRPREQLSPQEAQIAELAAQGLSNREIGQRLFLSHRTVGSHLYRVFPKLGVSSRTQLTAVLDADPVPTPGDG